MIAEKTRRVVFARLSLMALLLIIVGLALGAVALRPSVKVHAAPSGFVTHSGAQLMLNGNTFRFSGANFYYDILDENAGPISYPTPFRIDDSFATVQEMGGSVVRTSAASVGCDLCLEPSLGTFNSTAFQHLDYAIKSAGNHHIRLILELVDNYHYYQGGKHTFTDWRGDSNENDFYTNSTVIGDFEQYINTILNHVNSYTGVAYKNDPAILAWEEGNELNGAPASWVSTIANYIKSVDPNHLVSFSGSTDGLAGVEQDTLSVGNVDIEDLHFYPMSVSQLNSDASTVEQAGKAFYAGEYDWANSQTGWDYQPNEDSLSSFLSAIETNGTAGDTFWSLFPHSDTYGYEQHGDGFTLHYPGDTSDMQSRAQALRTHAYTMRGVSAPAYGTPDAPLITAINGQAIAWRGSTPSATYSVERSTSGNSGPWTVICNQCATDNNTPWTDSSQPGGTVWYRVRGYNLSNVPGGYSPVYQYNTASNLVQNPGFETGDLTGWNVWVPAGQSTSNAGVSTQPASHSGNYYMYEWNPSSAFQVSVYQSITNIPNGTYVASAWVQGDEGQYMQVRNQPGNNGTILAQTPMINPASADYQNRDWIWHLIAVTVTITGGQADIEFDSNLAANGSIRVDDVSFMPVPTNLVQNGGFETGDLSGWSVWNGSDGSGAGTAYTQANGQAHSGQFHGVEWKSSAYEVSLYQCIANVPNGHYAASAWVQSSGGQSSAVFSIDDGNHNTLASASIPSVQSWQLLTLSTVSVTTGTACLTFYSHAPGNTWIVFDDVSLIAV